MELSNFAPTFSNGEKFLSYKAPAGQTFTSYSPSQDLDAYLSTITGLTGNEQRQLLQSKYGSDILGQAASGAAADSISNLRVPGFSSKASCQTDADCGEFQNCYTFNDQVLGPQQGPTCSDTVYPEILLGNNYNRGTPLRQFSNFCYTDDDCNIVDEFTGMPKKGMSCNHSYKGPNTFENNGLCQVEYESKGRRFYLQQPPGWTMPLQEKLTNCEQDSDCGVTGINGWARCASGADDGNKYCVWLGQTGTPSPKDLFNVSKLPQGNKVTTAQQAQLNNSANKAFSVNTNPIKISNIDPKQLFEQFTNLFKM